MKAFLRFTVRAVFVASALLFAQSIARAFDPPAPEDLIIYQIFIDRFDNGDPSNDNGNPRAGYDPSGPRSFHGGDLDGIRHRLPYIRGLGANAIWITPFVENVDSYHGYGAYDWYNVDPNFGTIQDLRDLVAEANDIGISVFFDMVAGHMGDLIGSYDGGYPGYRPPPSEYNLQWTRGLNYPPPFDSLDDFHAHGHIGNYVKPEEELGELFGLDDLKTDTTYVREAMLDIWTYWIQETGVNGFRVDTVKHVDLGFWESFLPPLRTVAANESIDNFFVFGEIFGADDLYMQQYIGTLDGTPYKFDAAVDFQFYYTSQNVFARANRPPTDITDRLQYRQSILPGHQHQMPNFIDNHDVQRFLNVAQENPGSGSGEQQRRLALALVCLMTIPGPPIIYYGTEQAFDGGGDPYNREDMFDGQFEFGPSEGDNFDTSAPFYRLVSRLSSLRSALSPLRRGTLETRNANRDGPGILTYIREYNDQAVYIEFNTSTSPQTIPETTVLALAGKELADGINPTNQLTIGPDGAVPEHQIGAQDARIWVPAELLPPAPPQVLAFSPADNAVNVALDLEQIGVAFLTPMDEDATTSAVLVTPGLTYTTGWNEESTLLTLSLNEGLLPQTVYTVTVQASAASQEGAEIGYNTSASWTSGRQERPLPPMPTAFPALDAAQFAINIDGLDNDWPAVSTADNTGTVSGEGLFLWNDPANDDTGPGSYTYPLNSVFTDGDADLRRFQLAYDDQFVYILLEPDSINPGASFYTAYYGIAFDVAPGGDDRALGFDQNSGAMGITDLLVRQDAAPEFELNFTGPRGATLLDRTNNNSWSVNSAFSQQTGVAEIAVPLADLNLQPPFTGKRVNLFVYTALEVIGSVREVASTADTWDPGGGITELSDPDVFDLAGASLLAQQDDLSDYDAVFQSRIRHSILPLVLGQPEPTGELWMLY